MGGPRLDESMFGWFFTDTFYSIAFNPHESIQPHSANQIAKSEEHETCGRQVGDEKKLILIQTKRNSSRPTLEGWNEADVLMQRLSYAIKTVLSDLRLTYLTETILSD